MRSNTTEHGAVRWSNRRPARAIVLLLAVLAVLASGCGVGDKEAAPDGRVPAPRSGKGIFLSRSDVAALPTSGAAWQSVQEAASGDLGSPNIADQDSDHDVRTLAAALVAARTGDMEMQNKVVDAVTSAIGTERGGRTLAAGRNLQAYVIAADLIDLPSASPDANRRFTEWLRSVRTEDLDGNTLVETSQKRPNNWGTHATASLTAIAAYLGDTQELQRLADVFRGWTGERGAYSGFDFGDLAWQANKAAPVGVNPGEPNVGAHSVAGALPEEMRRGGGLQWPPSPTGYPWGAVNGAVVTAEILSRSGFDAWNWGDQALRRAVKFLMDLGWGPANDDEFVVPLVNARYGTKYPVAAPVGLGKNIGFTDWTFGSGSAR
jgi:Alginate lyase